MAARVTSSVAEDMSKRPVIMDTKQMPTSVRRMRDSSDMASQKIIWGRAKKRRVAEKNITRSVIVNNDNATRKTKNMMPAVHSISGVMSPRRETSNAGRAALGCAMALPVLIWAPVALAAHERQ